MHLVADDTGSHHRLQILELDFGRFLDLGIKLEAVEFIHAGRRSTHGLRKVRAVGASEAVGLCRHAHRFHQTQTRTGHVQEGVFFRRIHGHVVFAGAAGIHELQNDVFPDAFQIAPAPGFPGIRGSGASAFFHRPVVRAARWV